jgi:hypothetical protein
MQNYARYLDELAKLVNDLIFGIPIDENNKVIHQFNFISLLTRCYIYTGKNKKNNNRFEVYELFLKIRTRLE